MSSTDSANSDASLLMAKNQPMKIHPFILFAFTILHELKSRLLLRHRIARQPRERARKQAIIKNSAIGSDKEQFLC